MRVLIVKIGAVGDVVMALPLLSALRGAGASEVTWLCGQGVAPLLGLVEGVDEIVTLDEKALFRGKPLTRVREIARVWRRLIGRSFDLIIMAHPDVRYRTLTAPLIGGRRKSLGKGRDGLIRGRHHSNEYVRLALGLEGPSVPCAALPVIRPELPESFSAMFGGAGQGNVALAPGGARNVLRENALRRWPLESYAELAKRLVKAGVNVILTGDAADEWTLAAFRDLPIQSLIGKTGLTDLLAVYARCSVVVAHDSGPLHLAQLARTPLVALFGPTSPLDFVLHLSGGKVFWGGAGLSCRPCYDGRDFAACDNNVCLKEIEVDSVCDAVVEVLRGRREDGGQDRTSTQDSQ